MNKIIVYTDGGSRGNPGDSAIGIYFETLNKKYSEYIGKTTNNIAEYKGVIFALKKLKHLIGKSDSSKADVEIRSDSELIVKQLSGKFKIKDNDLIPIFIDIWNLKQDFNEVSFSHIKREKNKIADELLNEELDKIEKKNSLF